MLNQIILQGYMGKDPKLEEKRGKEGTYLYVSFTLGVGRDFGDETDWFYCSMIGKRAQVIDKYFRKGSPITVVGRLETYKDRNDSKITRFLVRMNDFYFVPQNKAGNAPRQSDASDIPDSYESVEVDVPF